MSQAHTQQPSEPVSAMPALVGVLATLPGHVKGAVEAYGAACARVALRSAKTAPTQQPQAEVLIRQYVRSLMTNNPDAAVEVTKSMVDYALAVAPSTIAAPQLEAAQALIDQQAAEPNAVLVEGFGRVAMRKLNDLHEKGYAINGVSIATISEAGETQLGAVTTGGRVLWWPQQATEPVAVTGCSYCLNKTAYKLTPTCTECGHDMLPANPAPTQQPLTEATVDSLYQRMAADERTKQFTAQNWFQAGVASAEVKHGITGSKEGGAA